MKESLRNDVLKKNFIEQIEQMPNVQIACKKVGLPRATYYRWRQEDEEFREMADEALERGVDVINDLAESKVISGVNKGEHRYVFYWLSHRHPIYKKREAKEKEIEKEREEYRNGLARIRAKIGAFLDDRHDDAYPPELEEQYIKDQKDIS